MVNNKGTTSQMMKLLFVIPLLSSLIVGINSLGVGFAQLDLIAMVVGGNLATMKVAHVIFGVLSLVVPIALAIRIFRE